ncbi:PREDICTED: interferon lambda receptor 1 [Ceratotherium simum simum]|uniref:Interferon lambda receptor 1 n=1 Tax=Ceratotherium simum simum TaxID=73337 RepID=A0ABM0HF75_CERSS|nr:PREDICTED: interferon lambda receptor 1 [Ceratotherium simum simum]
MAGARQWAPLLLCLLQSAAARPRLAPPQNVTLLSRNFGVYLTWLPGPGSPQDVTYFVAYQSSATPRRWRKVEKCAGIRELACSLMCLKKQDLYNKFKGRVRVVSPSATSPWVESKYLDYLFEVEPAPPVLVVSRTEEILSVNATYQLPFCMPRPDLKYEVDFWKEGMRNKTRLPVTPHGQPVQIPLQPATSGQHCLSARTIYTFGDSIYSKFSEPICFFLEVPGANWTFLVLLLLLLPLLLVIATGRVIWKSFLGNPWFQQAKMPQALDFSGHRHPVATFQPSGPESPDDLILCPQKELTRRVRLIPGVRAPATVQAGSEKGGAEEKKDEEEDEEDTDDSISVQPYLEPPSFLGQEHQIPGRSEAGTALVQAEGSPGWDSSDTSCASSGGSSPWEEAGSSGYLAKKGPGQGPGVDRCQEPLPQSELSEDLGSLEEPPRDDLSSWASWGSSSPGLKLIPGEPPISLQTLTFCWDSSPEEEEEEEEGGMESEIEDSSAGSGGADSCQSTEVRGSTLGHYIAR